MSLSWITDIFRAAPAASTPSVSATTATTTTANTTATTHPNDPSCTSAISLDPCSPTPTTPTTTTTTSASTTVIATPPATIPNPVSPPVCTTNATVSKSTIATSSSSDSPLDGALVLTAQEPQEKKGIVQVQNLCTTVIENHYEKKSNDPSLSLSTKQQKGKDEKDCVKTIDDPVNTKGKKKQSNKRKNKMLLKPTGLTLEMIKRFEKETDGRSKDYQYDRLTRDLERATNENKALQDKMDKLKSDYALIQKQLSIANDGIRDIKRQLVDEQKKTRQLKTMHRQNLKRLSGDMKRQMYLDEKEEV
jgi:hypothetical protein